MKRYSKKWMQTFIDGQLPEDKIIIEQMSKKAFEVESVEQVTDTDGKQDSLFEIKVLPNRVADAMCLEGMAREFAAVFDLRLHDWRPKLDLQKYENKNDFLAIETGTLRFSGFKIKINKQVQTPEWIKDILVKSGGRSINSIADISNLILYSVGQPNHAFDSSKIDGKISVRRAHHDEKLVVLGGKELVLREEDLVVADEKNALDLAGVRGGMKAEVTEDSTEFIWIIPNFVSTDIRKASTYHGIRTDSSKIFENGISTEKTRETIGLLLATILDVYKDAKVEFIFDQLVEEKIAKPLEINLKNINNYAGLTGTNCLSFEDTAKLLARQNFKIEKTSEENIFTVFPPHERLDINLEEDVSEEVLRIYGFDNILSVPLNLKQKPDHSPRFLFENYLKLKLVNIGFTEVYTYTFGDVGNVKVKLGMASDKEYLRNNLSDGAKNAFTKNYNYSPILEQDILKFFEIGTVFLDDNTEEKRCVIVCDDNKKKTKYLADLENILWEIENELGISKIEIINKNEKPALVEFSIDKIVKEIESKNIQIPFVEIVKNLQDIKYKQISIYPFIVRDIATWVPENFNFENLKLEILKLNLQNVEKIYLFDSFTKENKTSVAFRIIFQAYDRTLTDVEVETEMQKVNNYLKENKFEIR